MTKLMDQPDTCGSCAHYRSYISVEQKKTIGRCHSWQAHPGELRYRTVRPTDPCCPCYVPRGIAGAELG